MIVGRAVHAPASSPFLAVADQLAGLDLPDPVQIAPCLRDVLELVVDPRARRGVRHGLIAVLAMAVCAVVADQRNAGCVWRDLSEAWPYCLSTSTLFGVKNCSDRMSI